MRVEVETPAEFQGSVTGDLSSRRGVVTGAETRGPNALIAAEVPLASMFGYATDLRSMSQGKATFSMEFHCHRRVPAKIQEEIIEQARRERAAGRK
jgi:elongation factor G